MSAYGSHRLARLCAAIAVLGAVVGGCDGGETTSSGTTSSPTASASATEPAGGGMVMIYVKGVEAPFSSELAGVLYPGRVGPAAGARPGGGIGGFGVVVNTDGEFSTNQYVYAPDPKWRKSTDPFPHVTGDHPLVVEPGTYTLVLWLHYRLDTFFDGPWGVPDPFLSETAGGRILGYCATTFAVDDQGALVTVTGIPSPASVSTWPGPDREPRCATRQDAVRATPSAQKPPADAGAGAGGPVKVWVRDVQGPPGPYVSELAGVLFRHSPDTRWPGQGLGGFGVLVRGDPFWTVQYVQRPDSHWEQSPGLFPYVLPDVLTVPPGRYTLRLWLGTRLVPSTRSEYPGPSASRWIPGESYAEGVTFLGFCETTVVVEDARGVTVRVWFPEFPRSEMDFTTPCPTG